MNAPVSLSTRLAISIGAIAWFLLALAFLLALPVLLVWPLWVIGLVAVIGVVAGLVVFLAVRLVFGRSRSYSAPASLARWLMIGVALAAILFALPVYYFNFMVEDRPSTVPLATLTNGKKQVTFQGMMHIGGETFYKSVVYDLEKALDDGYVLFYEGVKDSPEAKQWFQDLMSGGKDLSAGYKMLADTCGLTFQLDYFGLVQKGVEADPSRHIVADVSQSDLKAEFDRLAAADPDFLKRVADSRAKEADGVMDSLLNSAGSTLETASANQKAIVGMVCRGFINMSSKNPSTGVLDPVILDFRNANLAKTINGFAGDKIYVTYGAAHLPGLVAELKKLDPAWTVTSVRYTRTIETPQDRHP